MPSLGEALTDPFQSNALIGLAFLLLKGALLLLVCEGSLRLLPRSSASVRHLIRYCSLVALISLPLMSIFLPTWEVPLLGRLSTPTQMPPPISLAPSGAQPSQESAPVSAVSLPGDAEQLAPISSAAPRSLQGPTPGAASAPFFSTALWGGLERNWMGLALLVWLSGALLLAARLLLSLICVQLTVNRAAPVQDGLWLDLAASAASRLRLRRPIELRSASNVEVALSVGLWRAVVLLPEVARTWSLPRRRSILLHELAHVKRRDNFSNLAGQLACILHWPNPLVWLAARRLVVERERACDDEVLAAGAVPSEYAGHLLEIARAVAQRRFWGQLEISQSSALKDRFKALLSPQVARHFPGTEGKLAAITLSALFALPLAALWPWKVEAGVTDLAQQGERHRLAGFVSQRPAPPPGAAFQPEQSPRSSSPQARTSSVNARFVASPPASSSASFEPRDGLAESWPSDAEIAERRAWPATRIISSSLSATARDLWEHGPPHRIWGAAAPEPGESDQALQTRAASTPARPGGEILVNRRPPAPPDRGPVQRPPGPPVLRAEVARLDLGTLGGDQSLASDINDAGWVVGQSKSGSGLSRPFLWSTSMGMIDLGQDLQVHSRALQINESGRVLCETFNSRFYRSFLWAADLGLQDVGALYPKRPFTVASDISEKSHVVGGSRDDTGVLRAFLWTPEEGMIDLGTPEWSEALAVNGRDQVVGYTGAQAFLWDREQGLSLIGPPNSGLSIATDINELGQVVGYADFGGVYPQAFLWTQEKGIVPLGTVSPHYPISFALSISDQGQVVGRSVTAPREGFPDQVRIFRWTPEKGMQDLGPIADRNQLAINALGQIVAAYSDGSEETEKSLAVVWTEQGPVTLDLNQAGGAEASQSELAAVNNKGQLVGSSFSLQQHQRRATLWEIRLVKEEQATP